MWPRAIAGVVLCLIGITWFLQGIGTAKGSPMTGHGQWTFFGAVLVLVGLFLVRAAARARRGGA